MTSVILDKVSVGFPILHVGNRSLKKSLVATATGGTIMREARDTLFVRALHDVSATFEAGDRVALIGPNGAGKTTLLRAIAGIYEPISGRVRTQGEITTLLNLGLGFHPEMTGRENIRVRCMYMGLPARRIREIAPEIEAFTELGEYLDMPIRTYSSGMQLRLTFAIATSTRPDILLMDEWVLAGDASFISRAKARMEEFVARSSVLVLATHSEAIIRQWCNKAMYLAGGEMRMYGDVDEALAAYSSSVAGQ
jgi:ABC-2 type transport system ATP-binding protein/lipopolysaccharide transport system ATP-binding protein